MAKSAKPAGPDLSILLEGLRKALSGPKPLTGKDALFPSGAKGKQAAEAAIEQGYLIERTQTIPPTSQKGKAKEVTLAELTAAGRQHVVESDSPKAVLESLLPALQALGTGGGSQPALVDVLRPELNKATTTCVKAIEDAVAKLQKSIETAFARLEQAVVKALPAPAAGPVLAPGPVLAALQAALARLAAPAGQTATPATTQPAHATVPPSASSVRQPPQTEPAGEPSPPTQTEPLRKVLRDAYDELCLFREFRDKLVEIPRLYHEAARRFPGLTVERFHHELESLSSQRQIELHKLNEVHMAKERNLAIEKNDRLYGPPHERWTPS